MRAPLSASLPASFTTTPAMLHASFLGSSELSVREGICANTDGIKSKAENVWTSNFIHVPWARLCSEEYTTYSFSRCIRTPVNKSDQFLEKRTQGLGKREISKVDFGARNLTDMTNQMG